MELTFTTLIIGGLFTFVGGSTATAVVVRLMDRKANRTKNAGEEIHLTQKVASLVNDQMAGLKQLQAVQTQKAAAELEVKIKDGQLRDLTNTMQSVLKEQGRAEERQKQSEKSERKCQQDLSELKERMAIYDSLTQVNERLSEAQKK